MGREARVEFEAKYTAEANYLRLMEIYRRAMEHARARTRMKRIQVKRTPKAPERFRPDKVAIGGVGVSVVNYDTSVRWIEAWAVRRESRMVSICPASGIVTARVDRD